VPPVQSFQADLSTPTSFPNYTAVKADIRAVLYTTSPAAGITSDALAGNRSFKNKAHYNMKKRGGGVKKNKKKR